MKSGPQKLLVRGVNWLGDAVMTLPAIQRLREALPGTELTLLTQEKLAEIYRGHPAIDRVITFTSPDSPFKIGGRLREHGFDTALIFPNSPRSALESRLARIPRRVGYGGRLRSWLLTERVERAASPFRMRKRSESEIKSMLETSPSAPRFRYPESAHQAHDYLRLAAHLGGNPALTQPVIRIVPKETASVLEKFGLRPTPERPLFGLNAGAEYGPAKCWPLPAFAEAALRIHAQTNCIWLIFGTAAQQSVATVLMQVISLSLGKSAAEFNKLECIRNLAGQTSLRELCVLIKSARLMLTNDSGPMHIAAAVGTPLVVPFGSTSPELTGPIAFQGSAKVLAGQAPCAPCFLRECPIDFRCMTSVSVETVVKEALALSSTGT